MKSYKRLLEIGYGGGPRKAGPLRQSYYGQDVGPGEAEDAEGMEPDEKKRKYYWREILEPCISKIKMEAGFTDYPKGWDRESVKKFGKTLTKNMKGGVTSKGFFDKCVKKMEGKVKDPKGFCAGVKDEVEGSTYWRGKDKSEKEAERETARKQNV